jgi:adenine phosphoribosyltransferase
MTAASYPEIDRLRHLIREVPDFPKKGILFYDITTLLKDREGLKVLIDGFAKALQHEAIDLVLGIEARGFIFGPALAYRLGAGFVPIRKPKKLPAAVERVEYALEYGTDALEIHKDAVKPGQRVLIVDDLLATGGTARAALELTRKLGGDVRGFGFVIELDALGGRKKLEGIQVATLIHCD